MFKGIKKVYIVVSLMLFMAVQLNGMRFFTMSNSFKTLAQMGQKNVVRMAPLRPQKCNAVVKYGMPLVKTGAALTSLYLGYTIAKEHSQVETSIVSEAPRYRFTAWYKHPSLHSLLRESLENFGLGEKNQKKALHNADKIIEYMNNHQETFQQEELIDAFAQCFTLQGNDIQRTLISPLFSTLKKDTRTYKQLVHILSHAIARSLHDVHQDLITFLFNHCSVEQKIQTAQLLAQAACPIIATLPPRIIKCIASADDDAAILLAQEAIMQRDEVNKACIHTIPMLAKMNKTTEKILARYSKNSSPLDEYLFTEHSGGGAVCASCKGVCKFKEDRDSENIAKLIKGVRVVCESGLLSTYWISEDVKRMINSPDAPTIYCTDTAWFVAEGETYAKLHQLYTQGSAENILSSNKIPGYNNGYTRAKLLGYKDEDIEFFYIRAYKLDNASEEEGKKAFKKAKEAGDRWISDARAQLDTMKDWHPKKISDCFD